MRLRRTTGTSASDAVENLGDRLLDLRGGTERAEMLVERLLRRATRENAARAPIVARPLRGAEPHAAMLPVSVDGRARALGAPARHGRHGQLAGVGRAVARLLEHAERAV